MIPEQDHGTRQLLEEKAAILKCLHAVKTAQQSAANTSHSILMMNDILPRNAKLLEKLLRMWGDCPDQTREMLSPGPIQFTELSKRSENYEDIKLPHLYFGFTCDMYICCLEKGQTQQDSNLITAWNAAQLSIHITNKFVVLSNIVTLLQSNPS